MESYHGLDLSHHHNHHHKDFSMGKDSTKPTRKRKKFIRKVACEVCGDVANDHIHYGATTCYSCRAFFRRSITSGATYNCAKNGDCEVNKETRKQCQSCRMKKCRTAGMKATWVMTDEEKAEKKEAAIAKKKLKIISAKSGTSFDRAQLPVSSYLKKRAEIKSRKGKGRSFSADGCYPLDGKGDGNTSSNDEDVKATRIKIEAEDSSSNCSSVASSSKLMLHQFPHSMVKNTITSTSTTLGIDEDSLISSLVQLEAQSRDEIPMSPKTMQGIMESLQTGACLQYAVAKEGYNTAVQRVAHFISKVDLFRGFDLDDRRALIGNNCHMVVNIKSARLLSPKNSLQRQLRFAAVNPHAITEARVPRLEYHQIFQSPWCCDADVEEQYHSMMESIFHLDMDEACCTLLVLAAMFDISEMDSQDGDKHKELYTVGIHFYDVLEGHSHERELSRALCPKSQITRREVRDKSRAIQAQQFYLNLLQRYLVAKVGQQQGNALINRYQEVLIKLKEMREILLDKTLQF